mmetsp:Transcript_4732/g.9046  ORF Transcript_4732/g.9046 Transcript_4732/m.9046 type:complete len:303 (+) Transcript_4732:21-929(+)
MNDDKRQLILERLKLKKIKEIHSYFDKDDDGFLNHEELSSLQHVTSGQTISRRKYKAVCNMFDCKPSQGLTLRALVLTYDSNGDADVDRDFDKVFGITRGSSAEGTTSVKGHDEKKEECIANDVGKDNQEEDLRVCEVPVEQQSNTDNVNIIDLLIAGEDPHIQPSTDGCTHGRVNMKQVPSKHSFQDIVGTVMEYPLGTEIQNGSKTEQGGHLLGHKGAKLSSDAAGRNISIPTVVTVDSNDDFDGKDSNLSSIEGWANDVVSKKNEKKTSLLGMEGTAYTDLHKRAKNTEDECSCLCTIS